MKTAVRVLVIIAAAIGFIWSIVGFFGSAAVAGVETGLKMEGAEQRKEGYIDFGVNSFLSFLMTIAALVFGIVCAREKSGKATTIVNALLLLVCGIVATALKSWIAGPIFVTAGLLGFLAGLMTKPT